MNKVILVGYLGRDPELRYTAGGQAVCNFSLATTAVWKGGDGEKNESTEWHRLVAWNKTAEICGEYLSKGRLVYVEGRIQTRQWTDREGAERRTTEIVVQQIQFLGSPRERSEPSPNQVPDPTPPEDEDIPF